MFDTQLITNPRNVLYARANVRELFLRRNQCLLMPSQDLIDTRLKHQLTMLVVDCINGRAKRRHFLLHVHSFCIISRVSMIRAFPERFMLSLQNLNAGQNRFQLLDAT